MKKWVTEDWKFELIAFEGKAANCRLGLEKGDSFVFAYECPQGMCPRVMSEIYTWCEVIKAIPINRDENGKPLPNAPRPQD